MQQDYWVALSSAFEQILTGLEAYSIMGITSFLKNPITLRICIHICTIQFYLYEPQADSRRNPTSKRGSHWIIPICYRIFQKSERIHTADERVQLVSESCTLLMDKRALVTTRKLQELSYQFRISKTTFVFMQITEIRAVIKITDFNENFD